MSVRHEAHDPEALYDATTLPRLGELAVTGDWACQIGDAAVLADIARELSARVPEPLHCVLAAFAEQCLGDPRRAVATWPDLREQLFAAEATERYT